MVEEVKGRHHSNQGLWWACLAGIADLVHLTGFRLQAREMGAMWAMDHKLL